MSARPDVQTLVRRVREHGALLPEHLFEPLLVKGKDALDLLHRLSTNNLREMRAGEPTTTVFTNEKGRIIDWVEAVLLTDGVVLMAHAAAASAMKSWVDRFVITEDVEVVNVTALYSIGSMLLGSVNPTASLASELTGIESGTAGSPLVTWVGSFGPLRRRRYLVGSNEDGEVREKLAKAGILPLTDIEYHALRVAAGVPSCPQELNDAHNPLESGLRTSVSFTKGCYIGQEVVARLDSYDKVQRELVVVAVSTQREDALSGAAIESAESIVGNVTSKGGMMTGGGEVMVMGYIDKDERENERRIIVRVDKEALPARILDAPGTSWWNGSSTA